MANKLCDSNKRVIGNITDVVRTVDGETMITLDTGRTFQFKSYAIYWDKEHNCFINKPYYPGTLNTALAPPATIVYWSDGSKTVVKCSEKDVFDPEKGLAMAIAKRCGGNKGSYYKEIQSWVEKSGKKYPEKPAAGKAVDLDVLKKYSSEANKDFEKFLSAAKSNNQSGALLHLTALVADLKILEIEINK